MAASTELKAHPAHALALGSMQGTVREEPAALEAPAPTPTVTPTDTPDASATDTPTADIRAIRPVA